MTGITSCAFLENVLHKLYRENSLRHKSIHCSVITLSVIGDVIFCLLHPAVIVEWCRPLWWHITWELLGLQRIPERVLQSKLTIDPPSKSLLWDDSCFHGESAQLAWTTITKNIKSATFGDKSLNRLRQGCENSAFHSHLNMLVLHVLSEMFFRESFSLHINKCDGWASL